MHSYEAWAGLLKFINDLCLGQVTLNHLIPRGHVEPMPLPTVFLRKRLLHLVFLMSTIIVTALKTKRLGTDLPALRYTDCGRDLSSLFSDINCKARTLPPLATTMG